MKTLENIWRLVFCVFIFFVIRDKIDKMLATPQLEPKIDWSKLSTFHGLDNPQFQPLYVPPKTNVNLPSAQDDVHSKLHVQWDYSPATPPSADPFAQPVAAPPADHPLQVAPPAPAPATE